MNHIVPVKNVVIADNQRESVKYTPANKYRKKNVGTLVKNGGLSLENVAGIKEITNTSDPTVST